MSKVISSFSQLYTEINGKLEIAIDNTLEILLVELKNIIDSEVYGWKSTAENPWEIYRTGQFLDSWQTTKSVAIGKMVQGEISQAIDVMQQFFVNGVEVHEDRENLATIIMSGEGYKLSDNVPKRDFWNPWILYIEKNLDTIFLYQCRALGLPLVKVGYTI